MKQSEKEIRERVIKIREKLDNGSYVDGLEVGYEPILDFPEKSSYPLEFQVYMEEIGRMNAGHLGWQFLDIDIPFPLTALFEKFDEKYTANHVYYYMKDYEPFGEHCDIYDSIDDIELKTTKGISLDDLPSDLKVVAHMPCNYMYYLISTKSGAFYTSFNWESEYKSEDSFLDWLERALETGDI